MNDSLTAAEDDRSVSKLKPVSEELEELLKGALNSLPPYKNYLRELSDLYSFFKSLYSNNRVFK